MALNPQYMIGPSIQEYFVDKTTGAPLAGGIVTYYKDNARSDLQTVYTLSGSPGSYTYTAIPNPVILSAVGTPTDGAGNDIRVYYYPYDDDGNVSLYYVTVQAFGGGVPQETRQAWPNFVTSQSTSYFYNFVRNPTFYSWSNSKDYPNIGTGSTTYTNYVADDWSYNQNDSTQTIEVSRGTFLAGVNYVPGNPPFYMLYNNTSAGSLAQTYNYFRQYFKSVQTLNGQTVTASIWANQISGAAGQLSITLTQYFGTGGSPTSTPTPTVVLLVPALTVGTWTQYVGTVFIPSIFGDTIGTNGDDALILSVNMPLNQVAEIGFTAVQLEVGTGASVFNTISNDDQQRETDTIGLYQNFTTGDGKLTLKTTADPTWVMANDGTLGNLSSGATVAGLQCQALYSLLWNNISNTYAPVVGGRGGSATADFNASKPIFLTKTIGRALAASGTATFSSTFTAVFTVNNNLLLATGTTGAFYNGMPVTLTTTGTLPAPLATATTYYVVLVDANNIQLATTQANAVAGTEITLTGNGTGTNTVTINYSAWSLGQYFGEQNHSQIIAEIASHSHTPLTGTTFDVTVASGGTSTGEGGTNHTFDSTTGFTGGSVAMNNMQPTSFWNVMIKL